MSKIDVNFLAAAANANAVSARTNKVAKFCRGEFPSPSLFSQKGVEKFLKNAMSLGSIVNRDELTVNLEIMISQDRESFVNQYVDELRSLSLDQATEKMVMAKVPAFTQHVNSIYNVALGLSKNRILSMKPASGDVVSSAASKKVAKASSASSKKVAKAKASSEELELKTSAN